jgi:hypothetical protein
MNIKKGGLKIEAFGFKDHNFERLFPKKADVSILPLGRDITGIPVIYQGAENSCVSCTVTWIKQWYEKSGTPLSWPFLAEKSGTDSTGAVPSVVLEAARKIGICDVASYHTENADEVAAQHKVSRYSFLRKYSPEDIFHALEQGPLAIGVMDFQGIGPHMMAAYDVTEDGKSLKCVNWWSANVQELAEVPFENVEVAVSFAQPDTLLDDRGDFINFTMPILTVLKDKAVTFLQGMFQNKAIRNAILTLLIGGGAVTGGVAANQKFGQSGVALGYSTTIVTPGISSSATSIPVASVEIFTGEDIASSNTIFPAYFVINPGSQATQELVECWNLTTTTTSPQWTGCVRGLSGLGSAATSTVSGAAHSHSPGERFVMTNAPAFFNRFVDIYTTQGIGGAKTFTSGGVTVGSGVAGTGAFLYFDNGQSTDSYFKSLSNGSTSTLYFSPDGVSEFQLNASGTTFGASSTKGIFLTDGLIGINASTTAGIKFDSDGRVQVSPSSTFALGSGATGTLAFDTAGRLYMSANGLFAGSALFGDGFMGASTTAAGTTTLTGDVYFTDYTVSTGTNLVTAGWRIFVSGTFINNGVVKNNGSFATNGTSGVLGSCSFAGGVGGAGALGGFFATGTAGSDGGVGDCGTGDVGITGRSPLLSIFTGSGVAGGKGGDSASSGGCTLASGGATSTAGSVIKTTQYLPDNYLQASTLYEFSTSTGLMSRQGFRPTGGGGSAGAGTTDGATNRPGGGGGGSGGSAGPVWIAARNFTNNWRIESLGGRGGDGGNGANCGSGGGGGAGGDGGPIFRFFVLLTETGTSTVLGGSPGTGGTPGEPGLGGQSGNPGLTGNPGRVYDFDF